jgi:hypothetical protein
MDKDIKINIYDALCEILDYTTLDENDKDEIYNKIISNLELKNSILVDSIELNLDIDLEDDDVIDYLNNSCKPNEITDILEQCDYIFPKVEEENIIKNLEDYYKYEILKDFFNKYSWEELENIKKHLN